MAGRPRSATTAANWPGHSKLAQFLLALPPFLAAMASMPLLLVWIMGASAFAGVTLWSFLTYKEWAPFIGLS